jgi:hypothetical protein
METLTTKCFTSLVPHLSSLSEGEVEIDVQHPSAHACTTDFPLTSHFMLQPAQVTDSAARSLYQERLERACDALLDTLQFHHFPLYTTRTSTLATANSHRCAHTAR